MTASVLAAMSIAPFSLQPTLASGLDLPLGEATSLVQPAPPTDAADALGPLPWRACFQGEGDAAEPAEGDATVPAFGTEGSTRWTIKGQYGFAINADDTAQQAGIGLGLQYFIVDDFAFAPEVNLWGFFQSGPDAWGVSGDLLFQWHFAKGDTWSIFSDFGCGVLGSNHAVPTSGSHFNFTPQAGFGVMFEGDTPDTRIVLGVKWHHISNASLYRNNPGRDSIEFYGGLNMPF